MIEGCQIEKFKSKDLANIELSTNIIIKELNQLKKVDHKFYNDLIEHELKTHRIILCLVEAQKILEKI